MDSVIILIKQLIIMVIYCMIGYILQRRKMISQEGCSAFSTLRVYVILPCVIISSFFRETTAEATHQLVISFVLAIALLLLSMAMSYLFFRKKPIDNFSSCFSQAGFTGVPLISSILGSDAIFLIAAYVSLQNILQWTYGMPLLLPKTKTKLTTILKNPLVVSLMIGVVVYLLPIQLPGTLNSCITGITKCNTPLSMIVLGYYLAEVPFTELFRNPSIYPVSISRLVVIPAATLLVLALIPNIGMDFKLALLIAASCPVGINVAIYAKRAGGDYHRASVCICQSAVLSLITLPLILIAATKLFA